MAIGAFIRQKLGSFEKPVTKIYRDFFVNLTELVKQIKYWVDSPGNILEVGCGEGAVTDYLVKAYPDAYITGIDITPKAGRLFTGNSSKVNFKQQTIKNYISELPPSADLIIIGDVMHHIPWEMHYDFLCDVKTALKPNGHIILKDWIRNNTMIHLLGYLSDRFITGDDIHYKSAEEFRYLIKSVFGDNCIKDEKTISPWPNNIAFLIKV
jgi:2-polyprenyl-3-methyl-5-hydroxy-6-metoxy-1,4-benzoquinol methylase